MMMMMMMMVEIEKIWQITEFIRNGMKQKN